MPEKFYMLKINENKRNILLTPKISIAILILICKVLLTPDAYSSQRQETFANSNDTSFTNVVNVINQFTDEVNHESLDINLRIKNNLIENNNLSNTLSTNVTNQPFSEINDNNSNVDVKIKNNPFKSNNLNEVPSINIINQSFNEINDKNLDTSLNIEIKIKKEILLRDLLIQQNKQNEKINKANRTIQNLRSELIKEKKQLRNARESLAQMYRIFNNMAKKQHETTKKQQKNLYPINVKEQWVFAIKATDFSEISLMLSTINRHIILNEDPENGRTALHYAVDAGHLPLTKYLVESVQNDKKFLNKKDKKGLTAVTIAFQNLDYRTLLFLRKIGATVPFELQKIEHRFIKIKKEIPKYNNYSDCLIL